MSNLLSLHGQHRNADPDLLTALTHKDDDLEVLEITPDGSLFVNTTLTQPTIEQQEGEHEELKMYDTELLHNQLHMRVVSIPVQVARTIFIVNATVAFMNMLLGLIPYYILQYDESRALSWIVFSISFSICIVSWVLLAGVQTGPALLVYLFSLTCVVGSVGSLLHSLAPLQAAAIVFSQSLSVLVYAVKSRTSLNEWAAGIYAIGGGLGVWFSGFFVFIVRNQWLEATLLFGFIFLSAAYMMLEIRLTSRFSLLDKSRIESLIRFYVDPILLPLEYKCCQGDQSSEEAAQEMQPIAE